MIAGMTIYQFLWYFCIYSVIGWMTEVAYATVSTGKVVNRGFLNGPVCPIYGFGIVSVFAAINLFLPPDTTEVSSLVIFTGGMLLATVIEYLTGWVLEKLFHARWWDYSDKPFNLHGYVCLQFSILWGFAVLFVVRIVQPFVKLKAFSLFPKSIGWILLSVFGLIYLLDLVVTVLSIRGLAKGLDEVQEFGASLRRLSTGMSEKIGGETINEMQKLEEARVRHALAKAELRDVIEEKRARTAQEAAELRAIFAELNPELAEKLNALEKYVRRHSALFGRHRILHAFPGLRSDRHQEALDALRKRILQNK